MTSDTTMSYRSQHRSLSFFSKTLGPLFDLDLPNAVSGQADSLLRLLLLRKLSLRWFRLSVLGCYSAGDMETWKCHLTFADPRFDHEKVTAALALLFSSANLRTSPCVFSF